ncbi:MAG: hypothetical protein OMM_10642, partial [Candidatus Magnetoglobus multicellularis str. Araruama]
VFEQDNDDLISLKICISQHNELAKNILVYIEKIGEGKSAQLFEPPFLLFEDLSFGEYQISFKQDNEKTDVFHFEMNQTGIYGK